MHIFISYRRDDSSVHARLLQRELSTYFGADAVFMDVEDIGWGDNFAARIDEALNKADVVVVVIGPRWVEILGQRLRGDDWVRHEVEQALRRRAAGQLRVLPVLVGGARWQGEKLPRGLSELPLLNAPTVHDASFDRDVVAVVEAIRRRTLWRELVAIALARRARMVALSIGLAVAMGAWTGVLDLLSLDTRLHTWTMALAGALGASPPRSGQVVLLPIDDDTVRAVGRPFGADWRAEHARIVDRAREAGARALAFDLYFDAPGASPAAATADAALAEALQRVQGRLHVVLAASEPADDGAFEPRLAPAFRRAADWGVACAGKRLGLAYAMPLAAARPDGGGVRPALALAAVAGDAPLRRIEARDRVARTLRVAAQGEVVEVAFFDAETVGQPSRDCPLLTTGDWVGQQLIDPATLALPFARVDYAAVLRGDPVALSALTDRVVLVGPMLPDRDRLTVPGGTVFWGMTLIAAQIDGLLQGRAVRAPGPIAQAVLGLGMGLAGAAIGIALNGRPEGWLVAAVLAAALAYAAVAVVWYRSDGQLLGFQYGWLALVLGALAARRIMRSAL